MADPIDVFADQFNVNLSPYGCTLNFQLTDPSPLAPGGSPKIDRLATVRMTPEHLKAMAFILHRQIVAYETQTRVPINMPFQMLQAMQVRQEDWEAFWHP